MKTLYIQCNMGAAGDMLMSALLELHPNPDNFIEKLNNLNIPNVKFNKKTVVKSGITGTHIDVLVDGIREDENIYNHHKHHNNEHHNHEYHNYEHHNHQHTGIHQIEHVVKSLDIPENVKKDVLDVFMLIADAESKVHGKEIEQIHFHEVGTIDAVADIVGVCMLINELSPDNIISSPVHVGCGEVKCAHGILPVPAPATAIILSDVPIYGGSIKGELCTPTGAALLKHFVNEFADMPVMKVSKVGYGMGTKEFESANCIRIMLGETENKSNQVLELCCNIDDMTGEEIGYAVSKLLAVGVLDVFTIPIQMKKNRPAILLSCICNIKDKEKALSLIFKYTSTIGVRQYICNRYILSRSESYIETKYGNIRVKHSNGFGINKVKPEYDDISKIADENNISIEEVKKNLNL